MIYTIKYACGHTEDIKITGSSAQREQTVKRLESQLCKACWAIEQHPNHDLIRMDYGKYKKGYSRLKTVPGSYDHDTKTIVVLIPCGEYQFPQPMYSVARKEIVQQLVDAGVEVNQVGKYLAVGSKVLWEKIKTFERRMEIRQAKEQKALDTAYRALEILKEYEVQNNDKK